MRLLELEPEFVRLTDRSFTNDSSFEHVASMADGDGLWFLCPVCMTKNGGRVGTHHILCWRPNVPQSVTPVPGRWEWEGSGFEDLTLVAGSSSVLLQGGCGAHFWIRSGDVVLA